MAKPQSSTLFSANTNTAVVRYQVRDVDRAVTFYTAHLGFTLALRPGPPLAIVSRGDLQLLLSGPDASGSRSMPDGRQQEPGGWNRIVLYVENLDSTIAALKAATARFRNDVEVGPGGKQIQVDDPDGNPIELHEAPRS
jgi:glyoxylase I family protein